MSKMAAILKFFKSHLLPLWLIIIIVSLQNHVSSPFWRKWPSWVDASLNLNSSSSSHLLPNSKSGWAETWWEASGWNGDSESLNHSVPISKMTAMVAILKLFKQHQILNWRESDLIAKMATMAQCNISWSALSRWAISGPLGPLVLDVSIYYMPGIESMPLSI